MEKILDMYLKDVILFEHLTHLQYAYEQGKSTKAAVKSLVKRIYNTFEAKDIEQGYSSSSNCSKTCSCKFEVNFSLKLCPQLLLFEALGTSGVT